MNSVNILRERARKLAQEPPKAEADGEVIEVVEFSFGNEKYGIETRFVREVHPLKEITPLPNTPPYFLGILNLRGQILPLLDLGEIFGLQGKGGAEQSKVIVLQNRKEEFSLRVDSIAGVRKIPLRQMQPSLPALNESGVQYVKGLAQDQLIVLEAEKLFLNEKWMKNEKEGA